MKFRCYGENGSIRTLSAEEFDLELLQRRRAAKLSATNIMGSQRKTVIRFIGHQLKQFAFLSKTTKLRKIQKSCLFLYGLASGFWSIPTVILLRSISKFFSVKITRLEPQAIGVFAPQVFLYYIISKSTTCVDICYYSNFPVSNKYWDLLTRRNIRIWPTWLVYPLDIWNRILPGGDHIVRQVPDIDFLGTLTLCRKSLDFTAKEHHNGKTWLKSKGWKEGDRFVCLIVRDSAYKEGSHSYRNSDIQDFIPACQWLASQGIYVIRMGKKMSRRLDCESDYILDYAFDKERSDFLDVWLFANCYMTISTGTGPDIISALYRKEILLINFLHLSYIWSWANVTVAPKKVYWKDSKRLLTISEYMTLIRLIPDLDEAQLLERVSIESLSPSEILDIIMDKVKTSMNAGRSSFLDEELMSALRLIESDPLYPLHHHWINPYCNISPAFRRLYRQEMLK